MEPANTWQNEDDWAKVAAEAESWQANDTGDAWDQSSTNAQQPGAAGSEVQWYDDNNEENEKISDHGKAPDNAWANDPAPDVSQQNWDGQDTNKKAEPTSNEDEAESFDSVENIIEGPWPSTLDYLRNHYLLLRENALQPLREAVEYIRSAPDSDEEVKRNYGIYDNVNVCGITMAKKGLAVRVKFGLGRVGKNIHWGQSKRLIGGSLVALVSPDKSITKLAIVASRSLELVQRNPPELDLFFGRAEDFELDSTQDWIMVEHRSAYFEGQRYTLTALQRMVEERFPLSEHLVNVDQNIPPPKYAIENPIRDLRSVFDVHDDQASLQRVDMVNDWPTKESSMLDESQMNALQNILTKQVSIVQGPPGTGKTYISVQALKILMNNMKPGDPPIIISTHTNHALDQLLRHVAEFEPDFVRLGGRTKEEGKIKERVLFELKQNQRPPPFKGQRAWYAIEGQIEKLITPLVKREAGPNSRDVFDLELLRELGVLTHQQANSVVEAAKQWKSYDAYNEDDPMLIWIGKQLEPVKQRHDPVLVGYEDIDDNNDKGFEVLMDDEAEQGIATADDEEGEKLGGTFWQLGDTWTGKGSDNKASRDHARELLKTKTDLSKIRPSDRGIVYRHMQRQAKAKIVERIQKLFPQYQSLCEDRMIWRFEFEESILKQQKVIGLTTTAVSKYRGLISSLKPKIVLIEEAAETLEAPVIATCMDTVEQLILVGDHQQLRPSVQYAALERAPYHLNISLFERLVRNKLEYRILTRQRRMKPEIRRMLKPIYGNNIRDHNSVCSLLERPPIKGMGGLTTWFLTHEYQDERDQESSSFNIYEGELIMGLVQYLRYNDVPGKDITILTFYNGQRRLIRKLFKDDEIARGDPTINEIKLVTVDSYQGEENGIVILSLVRSNFDGKIGFIGINNRICVALSRARRGFYIFGNAQLICTESKLWSEVISDMFNGSVSKPAKNEERPTGPGVNPFLPPQRIGFTLPLWCERHQRRFWIQSPLDWQRNVGGCDLWCRGRLPCGHACKELCHPWRHDVYSCRDECRRNMMCGHRCERACFEPCECSHACARRAREAEESGVFSPPASARDTHNVDASNRVTQEPARSSHNSPAPSQVSERPQVDGSEDRPATRSRKDKGPPRVRLIDIDDEAGHEIDATLAKVEWNQEGDVRKTWTTSWMRRREGENLMD